MKVFTEQEIEKAYSSAPALIQDTLAGDELAEFGSRMQNVYKLHIDTISIIADLIRNLLIGLINPSEFIQSIQEHGVDSQTVNQLARDLNEEIFVPLQEKMKSEGVEREANKNSDSLPVTSTSTPAVPTVSIPEVPVAPQIRAVVTPPIQVQRQPEAVVAPVPASTPTPSPKPVFAPSTPPAPITAPAPTPQSAPAPYTPPVSQPSVPLRADDPHRDALRKIVKEYTADPYREPI